MLSGLARSYAQLLAGRAMVGIGEAAYVAIAPALLADCFDAEGRGRVYAVLNMAIPVGAALGYIVGGQVSAHFGWRAAFFVAGVPGLLLALAVLRLPDPPRGAQDARAARPGAARTGTAGLRSRSIWDLLRRWPYMVVVLGYAAYTFALGGLAFWMPTFLERVRHVPAAEATTGFGEIVLRDGIPRHLRRRLARATTSSGATRQAYLWFSGVGHAARRAVRTARADRAVTRGLLPGDRRRGAAAVHVDRAHQRGDRQHRRRRSSAPPPSRSACSRSTCSATCPRRCSSAAYRTCSSLGEAVLIVPVAVHGRGA